MGYGAFWTLWSVHAELSPEIEALGARVVDACFRVHRGVGVGCAERVYHRCFEHVLKRMGVPYKHEAWIDVVFEGILIKDALRVDFTVGDTIAIEFKATPQTLPAHEAQLINYMRHGRKQLGFLVNFHEPYFKAATRRFVHQKP